MLRDLNIGSGMPIVIFGLFTSQGKHLGSCVNTKGRQFALEGAALDGGEIGGCLGVSQLRGSSTVLLYF